MSPGTKVRMSEDYKKLSIDNHEHVEEFGDCIGIVEDLFDSYGIEVNVRWQPSNLRYAYHPKNLVVVDW